jgi:hypothetical protein
VEKGVEKAKQSKKTSLFRPPNRSSCDFPLFVTSLSNQFSYLAFWKKGELKDKK